ncbi:coiled-coil domain-containing protein 83 [Denticeps clupeoides]|uniref:coiled-coil domain-containing protein 83 n=1 Tax=Denticeps clupeoides TaxID=299321 RepID=UPI0010A30D38|nr:trichohyalin-like [Denticeps clupeoides]
MGKKSRRDRSSLSEVYLHFQIEQKKREIQEFQDEKLQLQAKNQKQKELLQHLREEQKVHTRALIQQTREQERKLVQKELVHQQRVKEAHQLSLELVHNMETRLVELPKELSRLEEQLLELGAEQQTWLQYKNFGSLQHQRQVQQREDELLKTQHTYQEMSGHVQHMLETMVTEINEKMDRLIDEQKHLAVERAVELLDLKAHQEIQENQSLKKHVALFKKKVSSLEEAVKELEEKNLEMISGLVEQRLDDLQMSRPVCNRNVFLTQTIGPADFWDKTTETASTERATGSQTPVGLGAEVQVDEGDRSSSPSRVGLHDVGVVLYGRQADLQESKHPVLLEKRVLMVIGQAATLHTSIISSGSEDWPVTSRMIQNRFQ